MQKYIYLAIVGLLAVTIFIGHFSTVQEVPQKYSSTDQPQKPTPNDNLNATVDTDDLGVTIYNNDSKEWKDCTTSINQGLFGGGYTEHEDTMFAKGENNWKNFISFSDFTKEDGTRFDLSQTKIQSVQILCKDNGQGNTAGFVKSY